MLCLAVVGCTRAGTGPDAAAQRGTGVSTTLVADGSEGGDAREGSSAPSPATTEPAAPTTSPEPTTVRSSDTTDVAELAAVVGQGATGDNEWIEVMAELRAKSWLALRYPGRFELSEIYSDEWTPGDSTSLQEESEDKGLYIDEPLPILKSVVATRRIGQLVELDVVLDAGVATIRREGDDAAVNTLPGEGTRRGLFVVGQEDTTGSWRIHSVAELQLADDPSEEGS